MEILARLPILWVLILPEGRIGGERFCIRGVVLYRSKYNIGNILKYGII